jgi:chemotaxis protein methyltransferase CheR
MTVTAPSQADLSRFRHLVQRELGLRMENIGPQYLERALTHRLAERREGCEGYLDRLDFHPELELPALSAELTVGETYFLRHIEQFQALTRTALPQLRRSTERSGPLRLLSAGCSTGEEAYTLAMVVRESGIDREASVLGVDINPESLARARSGRYTDWSLRSVPQATRQRWFTTSGDDVVLDPVIRATVRFERRNLAQDEADLWRPEVFDVVFCRNVIMYFTHEVMTDVVRRIARSLVPGGYLFLGSAETLRGLSTEFEVRESQGTFYYQRPARRTGRTRRSAVPTSRPAPTRPEPVFSPEPRSGENLDQVMELLRRERFTEALALMDEDTGPAGGDPEALLLRAALLTHSGRLSAAEKACRHLLDIDNRSAGAHVLLAMCREGEHDLAAAADHCRTAISFDPEFAMPHVHLGRLAGRMGDSGTARRQYAQSARLLPAETGRRILLFGGGFDREALISLCRTQGSAAGEQR